MQEKVDALKKGANDLGDEFQLAGIKLELKKYELEINDLALFAKAVKEADEHGHDGHLIGSRLAYWDELEQKELDLLIRTEEGGSRAQN